MSRTRSTDVDKIVGANVRRIRVARGMTQMRLAVELGVSFQQIQKYDNGKNAVPSSRMPLLCRILRTAPAELFLGTLDGANPEPVKPMSATTAKMAAEINALSPNAYKIMAVVLDAVKEV